MLEVWLEMGIEMFDFNHDLAIDYARSTGFSKELSYRVGWRIIVERYEREKKAYLGRR